MADTPGLVAVIGDREETSQTADAKVSNSFELVAEGTMKRDGRTSESFLIEPNICSVALFQGWGPKLASGNIKCGRCFR